MNFRYAGLGLVCGLINGFFGAGAGLLLVPGLQKVIGLEDRQAHATSVSIVLIISLFSIAVYGASGQINYGGTLPYIIGGVGGALLGSRLLEKMPAGVLSKIFGVLLVWSSIRMFMV